MFNSSDAINKNILIKSSDAVLYFQDSGFNFIKKKVA